MIDVSTKSFKMNVLILNGNPEKESFSKALSQAYHEGALQKGHHVELVHIRDLRFDPILWEGYHSIQELEPDLVVFQEKIKWAEHLTIVFPTWWGGMPAILKGLFDRCFLSGFAFKYHAKDPLWDKLLVGKTAQIITTMDAPKLWYWLIYRSCGTRMLKRAILEFCGISPVKTHIVGRMRYKTPPQLEKELLAVKQLGAQLSN